jgi:hypothetical protein
MALGSKKVYEAKDQFGDSYKCVLREATPEEWAQYKKESMDFMMNSRKVEIANNVAAVKVQFFDLVVIDVESVYDKNGEAIPFNLTTNKAPAADFEMLKKELRLPMAESMLDLIPYQVKLDAVTYCFDSYDEQVEVLKKNSGNTLKTAASKKM